MRRANRIRRWWRLGLCGWLCLTGLGAAAQNSPPSAKSKPQTSATAARKSESKKPTTARSTGKRTSSHSTRTTRGKKTATKRGQQGIDSARAREIQTALIRQKYMQGEPSGSWDSATQAAMRRYQEEHGWQSKTIPDARALIRLGLGPSSDHLLNPESAMTAAPTEGDPKSAVKQTPPENNVPQQ